jgi:hypothetical protein
MKAILYGSFGALMVALLDATAQSVVPAQTLAPKRTAPPSIPAGQTNSSVLLSNSAVQVIARARGIDAGAVKLKFFDAMSGRFEVDLAGAADLRQEAELLSTTIGTNYAVIMDEATADGRMRTNHVFRAGVVRRTVAPVVNQTLPPGGRRLYVWPETSKVPAPTNVRLVQQ